jgi:hypothetical protein
VLPLVFDADLFAAGAVEHLVHRARGHVAHRVSQEKPLVAGKPQVHPAMPPPSRRNSAADCGSRPREGFAGVRHYD